MKKELSEELQAALRSIVDDFEREDRTVRERQIRQWKKLEYFWSGFTKIWWSEVAHDWRIYDPYDNVENGDVYDKQVNVFRAYLETVIAAMSSTVPGIKCIPDDADNPSDILTARGGTKIADLIYKHNDVSLLWIKALFVYCIQGMIAAYNYTDESDEYGQVETGKYENAEEEVQVKVCPICGMELQGPELDLAEFVANQEKDEYNPGTDDAILGNIFNSGKITCANCAQEVDPELKNNKITVTRLVGTIKKPKARQKIEVNGGLYVKVANYARKQCDTPYLAYSREVHYSFIFNRYKDLREKYRDLNVKLSSSSGTDAYERWGRLSPQYYGEYPQDTPTLSDWWLRYSSFETIQDDDTRRQLQKKFPDGCKVTYVNDQYVESCNEALDDHWTLTYNPLSEYIHFDPLGYLLTAIQEITNDLISLTLQTIEHGVPTTVADPAVLDFNAYREMEVVPGNIIPGKAKGGKSLGDGFFTFGTATLSREVEPFGNKIQEMGQFVSGALPSLSGTSQPGSSRTAAQYAMSRNQAQQRLQTPWKMVNTWWKNIFGKVIPAYIKDMLEDERVVKEQNNSFINVIIHKAQLDGKIGSVEVTSNDDLPTTLGQVKDAVQQLMQSNNPMFMAALAAPENLELLREALGLDDFNLPGQQDREKQFEEIQIMLKQEPINDQMPSVMPDFEIDDHKIEADICRTFLVGEAGRQAKVENPGGYKNILLHYKMHIQMLQQLSGPPPPSAPSNGKLNSIPGKQVPNAS